MIKHYRLTFLLLSFVALAFISYSCNLANSSGAFELKTSTTPEQGGTVEPSGGKFEPGSEVQIQAVPAQGYRFIEWSGDLSGTTNPATIKFDSDKIVNAEFEAITQYTLHVEIEGQGTVNEEIVAAKGDYEEGTTVQVTAVPADGWIFSHWEGDLQGNENPAIVEMDAEKTIIAVFQPDVLTLDILIEGEGTVQEELLEDEEEIFASENAIQKSRSRTGKTQQNELTLFSQSPEKALTDYEAGSSVMLTAIPAENWQFLRWEGSYEGDENPVTIQMDSSMTITAVFMEVDDDPEVIVSTNNVTSITTNSAQSGGNVTINGDITVQQKGVCWSTNAAPDTGNNCTDNGNGPGAFNSNITGLSPSTTYYLRAYAETSEGIFYGNEEEFTTQAEQPDLFSVNIVIVGEGSVSLTPNQAQYEEGEEVVLVAIPDQGWQFNRWEGDLSGSENPEVITITENMSITAFFEEQAVENEISVTTHNISSITYNSAVSGGNINADGVTVTQRGVCWDTNENPNIGDSCTNDGSGAGTFTSNLTDLEPSTTYHVRAYAISTDDIAYGNQQTFTTEAAPPSYTVTVNTQGNGSVSVDPDLDEYIEGTEITIVATAAEDWEFVEWIGDLTGNENPATVTVDDNLNITAVFEETINSYQVNITTQGQGNVSISPDQDEFEEGSEITLNATADEGWEFVEWTGDLTGNENPAVLTVNSNLNITAVFEEVPEESYQLNIGNSEGGTVDVDPEQEEYEAETVVTLTAVPLENYHFEEWQGDLTGTENPETIVINSDMNITAIFEETVTFTIETSTSGNGTVDVDPEQDSYLSNDEVTFTAAAAEGWEFVEWQGDLTGTENPVTVTITADMSVTAVFEEIDTGEESMSVSHGFVPEVTPQNIASQNASRSYPVIQANWEGPGGDKRWLGYNLGATGPPQSINDDDPDRAGWYFQFNRSQGYYEDDTTHESIPFFPPSDIGVPVQPQHDSDWITDDPCTIALGNSWRIPNRDEWNAVMAAGAVEQLNLHNTGIISHNLGALFGLGANGAYWTSIQNPEARPYAFAVSLNDDGELNETTFDMETGLTVRCIEA